MLLPTLFVFVCVFSAMKVKTKHNSSGCHKCHIDRQSKYNKTTEATTKEATINSTIIQTYHSNTHTHTHIWPNGNQLFWAGNLLMRLNKLCGEKEAETTATTITNSLSAENAADLQFLWKIHLCLFFRRGQANRFSSDLKRCHDVVFLWLFLSTLPLHLH